MEKIGETHGVACFFLLKQEIFKKRLTPPMFCWYGGSDLFSTAG